MRSKSSGGGIKRSRGRHGVQENLLRERRGVWLSQKLLSDGKNIELTVVVTLRELES